MDLPYSHRISRVLWYSGYPPANFNFAYETITLFGASFQMLRLPKYGHYVGPSPRKHCCLRFGLFPVRSPLLRKSFIYFLFLQVLRCFSSLGSLHLHYFIRVRIPCLQHGEFPHSEISGFAYWQLPGAYRSLSRPSSASSAKAFASTLFVA